jgi:hypothetical protein
MTDQEIKDEIASQIQLQIKKLRPQIVLIDAESFEKLKASLWEIDWRSAIASILLTFTFGLTQNWTFDPTVKPAIQSIVEQTVEAK